MANDVGDSRLKIEHKNQVKVNLKIAQEMTNGVGDSRL